MTDYANPGDDRPEADTLSHVPANGGAPTESLVAGAVGDRCVACGAPLSSDQRYCVVCGERRGASRFSLPTVSTQDETTRVQSTRPDRRGLRNGMGLGSGATLIAGVGTLLLAMLVGVLIGHNTAPSAKTVASSPVRVIKINEGASAPSASTLASGSSAGASDKKAKKSSGSSSKAKTHTSAPSKAAAKKEASAASKVTGGSGGVPSTVTVGATGSGKGYSKKTHKFNGSFFGQ